MKKIVLMSALALTACSKTNTPAPTAHNPTDFVGCYSVKQEGLAQIKISQDTTDSTRFVMQMKEPQGAKSVWDEPERLENLDVGTGFEFFKVNTLGINQSDVEAVIARPDKVMALAKVKSASKNINPKLDSDFVVYIFRGSNTIYQVACDDTPIDIVKDGAKSVQKMHN